MSGERILMQAALNNPNAIDMTAIAEALIDPGIPAPEKTGGVGGAAMKAQGAGHQHPRLTSAQQNVVTNASGIGSTTFTRTFAVKPCPVFGAENADGVTFTVLTWTQDAQNNYTGCTFRATRRTASSSLTNAVVALVSVITGVTTTTSDTPVANLSCSVVMLQQS